MSAPRDRRRRPRLLGPEPRPQLRRAARLRAGLVLRRLRGRARRAGAPQLPRRALHRRARRPARRRRARRRRARHAGADPRRARRARARRGQALLRREAAGAVGRRRRARRRRGRGRRARADGRPPARVPPGRGQAQGDRRLAASSATSTTSTPTASTSASCAPTRTRCGRSAPTTSRSSCTSPARSPPRSRRAASPTCGRGIEDVVFGFLRFPSGLAAHLHLSWLDPHKERRFTVVGSRRMATFDDMDLERKVTVYDKGFDEDAGLLRRVHHPLGRHLEPARSPTASRCGSSASTSWTASARGARRAPTAPAGCASCACSRALQAPLDASRREQRAAV